MSVQTQLPSFRLYHYYECQLGPFRNLSDLPLADTEALLARLCQENTTFAGKRAPDYLTIRRTLEEQARRRFIDKGGRPQRARPHYLTVAPCPWLLAWYQKGCQLAIPRRDVPAEAISFTYGDMFPALRLEDGRPYRGQVYTLGELADVIAEYGLPQDWNPLGQGGPERYIEAQLWADWPLVAAPTFATSQPMENN